MLRLKNIWRISTHHEKIGKRVTLRVEELKMRRIIYSKGIEMFHKINTNMKGEKYGNYSKVFN